MCSINIGRDKVIYIVFYCFIKLLFYYCSCKYNAKQLNKKKKYNLYYLALFRIFINNKIGLNRVNIMR